MGQCNAELRPSWKTYFGIIRASHRDSEGYRILKVENNEKIYSEEGLHELLPGNHTTTKYTMEIIQNNTIGIITKNGLISVKDA